MSSFKDYIGSKDVKWWDGIARTFSRLTSTGGTLTSNKIGHMVDVLAVYGSHDTYTGASIQSAVTSVGSNTCIFLLTPGTWTISANLTIPANVTLYVPHGVTISVATGITLTINGPVMAGSYQIFDGVGTIAGTPILLWRDATWFSGTITDSTTPTYKNVKGGAVTAATSVSTDTISELTAAAGVTIDGVKLKDSQPYCDVINEKTAAAGVTIDGVKLKDNEPYCDVINERTPAAGVTVDSVLLKDNAVRASTIESTVVTGTAPLTVASTTEVANLKAATATSLTFATEYSGNNTAQSLSNGSWTEVMTLDIGSVTSGDRIYVAADALYTSGNSAGANGIRIVKSSGTGDFTCFHNTTSGNGIGNNFYQGASLANVYISIDGIIKVSSTGTLILAVDVLTNGTGGQATPQLYVAILKDA